MGLHMWAVLCCAVLCCAGCELYSVMLCVSYVMLWCVCCVWVLWCEGVSTSLCMLHCGAQVLLYISSVVYVIYESGILDDVCVCTFVWTHILCVHKGIMDASYLLCVSHCVLHSSIQLHKVTMQWAYIWWLILHIVLLFSCFLGPLAVYIFFVHLHIITVCCVPGFIKSINWN